MQDAQGVGPPLRNQTAKRLAHLRPKQRVTHPALRLVDVEFGGHDVIVPCQARRARRSQAAGRRSRSIARTNAACSRTWDRAPDFHSEDKDSRSGGRGRSLRYPTLETRDALVPQWRTGSPPGSVRHRAYAIIEFRANTQRSELDAAMRAHGMAHDDPSGAG
jgi:hypothetical protein